MNKKLTTYEMIYAVVHQIPKGRVATYGQIAKFLEKCTPRMVGYALSALNHDSDVPWHRVVNSRGKISRRTTGEGDLFQREILKHEGIFFTTNDTVDLFQFGWTI